MLRMCCADLKFGTFPPWSWNDTLLPLIGTEGIARLIVAEKAEAASPRSLMVASTRRLLVM
jgi:hypothetical protein